MPYRPCQSRKEHGRNEAGESTEGGGARGRTVMLGRIRDGSQEIVEGLKVGDKVVVSGQSKLSDGTAVVVQPDESTRHESR